MILGANNPELIRLFKRFQKANPEWKLVGFLDNDKTKQHKDFRGYNVVGGSEAIKDEKYKNHYVVNGITRDAITRRDTTLELIEYGARFTNLIHPNVDTEDAILGKGLYIQESVIIQPEAVIRDHVAINGGSIISHETEVGEFSFIAPGCVISGKVTIGNTVLIGTGAVVKPRIKIGEGAVIGSGAVVTKDVEPYTVSVGCPARAIRKVVNE